jgi:hypothetical protein
MRSSSSVIECSYISFVDTTENEHNQNPSNSSHLEYTDKFHLQICLANRNNTMIISTDIFLKSHFPDIEILVHKNDHVLRSLVSNLTKIRQDILLSSSTKEQNDTISHTLVKFEKSVNKKKLTNFEVSPHFVMFKTRLEQSGVFCLILTYRVRHNHAIYSTLGSAAVITHCI